MAKGKKTGGRKAGTPNRKPSAAARRQAVLDKCPGWAWDGRHYVHPESGQVLRPLPPVASAPDEKQSKEIKKALDSAAQRQLPPIAPVKPPDDVREPWDRRKHAHVVRDYYEGLRQQPVAPAPSPSAPPPSEQ